MNQDSDRIGDEFENAGLPGEPRYEKPSTQPEIRLGSAEDERNQEQVPQTANQKSNRAALLMGLGGIVFVTGAIGFSAVTFTQISQLRSHTDGWVEDMDTNIASLGQSQTNTDITLNKLQNLSSDNAAAISQFDTEKIANDVGEIREELGGVVGQLRASSADSRQTLADLRVEVVALKADLEMLAVKKTAVLETAKHPAADLAAESESRGARINVLDTLEGLNVVSVDSWGLEANVVLHDPITNQYLTAALGDPVLGWVYTGTDNEMGTVTFSKNRKIVVVRIQG